MSVTVIANGTGREQTLPLQPYAEALPSATAQDIVTDTPVTLADHLTLAPRQVLLLDFRRK